MTIRAKQLDIVTFAESNLAVELDAINAHPFNVSTTVDVIELQNTLVVDSALFAAATKFRQRLRLPQTFASSSAFSAELTKAIRVISAPLRLVLAVLRATLGFTARIVAFLASAPTSSSAEVEVGDGLCLVTASTGSRFLHIENLSGKRVPTAMDSLVPGYA